MNLLARFVFRSIYVKSLHKDIIYTQSKSYLAIFHMRGINKEDKTEKIPSCADIIGSNNNLVFLKVY